MRDDDEDDDDGVDGAFFAAPLAGRRRAEDLRGGVRFAILLSFPRTRTKLFDQLMHILI
jgi:hypothetical protein